MLPFSIMFLHAQVLPFSIVIYIWAPHSSGRSLRSRIIASSVASERRLGEECGRRERSHQACRSLGLESPSVLVEGLAGDLQVAA